MPHFCPLPARLTPQMPESYPWAAQRRWAAYRLWVKMRYWEGFAIPVRLPSASAAPRKRGRRETASIVHGQDRDLPLRLHNLLACFALLDGTASTPGLRGTLLRRSHPSASALLRHFEITSFVTRTGVRSPGMWSRLRQVAGFIVYLKVGRVNRGRSSAITAIWVPTSAVTSAIRCFGFIGSPPFVLSPRISSSFALALASKIRVCA